jgi:hypothetical protein
MYDKDHFFYKLERFMWMKMSIAMNIHFSNLFI